MNVSKIEHTMIAIVPFACSTSSEVAYTITFVKKKMAVSDAKMRKLKKNL